MTAGRTRAGRGRSTIVVATLSSVVVLGLIAAVIGQSSGWPKVQKLFFDRKQFTRAFFDSSSISCVPNKVPAECRTIRDKGILSSLWYTVQIFVVAEVIVLVLGMLIAITRLSRSPALAPFRVLATVFVDVMRSVPAILLVLLFGFGIPTLGLGRPWNKAVIWGVLAIALMYSAYVSEVFRSGIESVHPSQMAAARSLGMTRSMAMRQVILPQAVRRVIPPLLNDYIGLQKDTALIHTVGVIEMVRRAQILQAKYYNYTPYVTLLVIYLVLTVPLTRLADRLVSRERARQR